MARDNRESLLNLIRRLYTKLFLVSLHNRIDSYHSFLDSDDHEQISGALYNFIDEIVQEASHNYTPIDYKTLKFLDTVNNSNAGSLNHLHNRSTTMVSIGQSSRSSPQPMRLLPTTSACPCLRPVTPP